MATAAERMRRHRDRKRRGIVAVVPVEIHEDWIEIMEDVFDLDLTDYPDGNYSAIPMDVLRPAAQEFVDTAVALAKAGDD